MRIYNSMDKYLLTRSILNAAAQSIRCSIQYICVEKALKCATCDILIGIHCQKVNNSSIVSQYEQHFISVAQASFFFSSFVLRLLYESNVIECKWYSALQWQGYHSSIYWEEWKNRKWQNFICEICYSIQKHNISKKTVSATKMRLKYCYAIWNGEQLWPRLI